MKRDTDSKAVLRLTGPRGQRVPGRSCVTLRLAPAAGSARYAIQGGRDLALVVLTPPPPPRKSRTRTRIDTSGQLVGGQESGIRGQGELIRPALTRDIFAVRSNRRLGHKSASNSYPISDIHNTSHNHRHRPKRRWRTLNHGISNGSKRRREAVTAKISEG